MEGSPTNIDYRKKGTLIETCLLEDLGYVQEPLCHTVEYMGGSARVTADRQCSAFCLSCLRDRAFHYETTGHQP